MPNIQTDKKCEYGGNWQVNKIQQDVRVYLLASFCFCLFE